MKFIERVNNYNRQSGRKGGPERLTPRQLRRVKHKHNRSKAMLARDARAELAMREAVERDATAPSGVCDTCGVPLGDRCVTASGKPAKSQHTSNREPVAA